MQNPNDAFSVVNGVHDERSAGAQEEGAPEFVEHMRMFSRRLCRWLLARIVLEILEPRPYSESLLLVWPRLATPRVEPELYAVKLVMHCG